jgi:hypothetical protein
MQSFANMHWRGLYSIALGKNRNGGLSRLFIARPGELHADLQDLRRPFLYHAHRYDFQSTTLVGAVENEVWRPKCGVGTDKGELFHSYQFDGVMDRDKPQLTRKGYATLVHRYNEFCGPGQSYNLDNEAVHRVGFYPDPRTGWFAVRLDEGARKPRPELCYSKQYIGTLPDAEHLYTPITDAVAAVLLKDLSAANGLEPICL